MKVVNAGVTYQRLSRVAAAPTTATAIATAYQPAAGSAAAIPAARNAPTTTETIRPSCAASRTLRVRPTFDRGADHGRYGARRRGRTAGARRTGTALPSVTRPRVVSRR